MTFTLAEIHERQEQLRQEIVERECLLAALGVLQKHASAGRAMEASGLGALLPALMAGGGVVEAETVLPELPPAPPQYVHPELAQIGSYHGCSTLVVRWAIGRLTGDYTVQDVAALLAREGRPLKSAELSVILTRLKKRGEIVEIKRGSGRKPAVFRQRAEAAPVLADAAG